MTAKRELEKIVNTVKRNKGNRSAAAKELGIDRGTLTRRLDEAAEKGIKIPAVIEAKDVERATMIADNELHDTWSIYERYGYSDTAAAEALGLTRNQLQGRIKKAMHKFGYVRRHLGATHALSAKKNPLPKKGEVHRILLTSAQNNTLPHMPTFESLIQLSKYYRADIKIATFTYAPQDDGSVKRGTDKTNHGFKTKDRWYDSRLEPYFSDEYEQLAPGLVWCGHWNSLPTSQDPLRGTESITGRASGIFPHPRFEMRPIATVQGEGTKFNWTTGCVTLRNYMQKRAGLIGEFHHGYGALLVEIDDGGNWWVRQLNADSEGTIYDIDIYATPEGVFQNEDGLEALVFGDIHRRNIDEDIMAATWGPGGMVDVMKPKRQIFHDLLDFESRSHHNRRDPHEMYRLYHNGRDVVWDEVREAGEFLDACQEAAPNSTLYVVDSNHDRHFDRYLKEVDWRSDLPNARTILEANLAMVDAIEQGMQDEFQLLEWAWSKMGVAQGVHVMNLRSENPEKLSLVVCEGNGGGVELALHGDISPNGARGNARSLSKIGRKNVIGHSHSPGIWGGTYVAGVTGKLRQGYNLGPSSWAHAHVPVYPNGKRQVILFWNGLPWAPR